MPLGAVPLAPVPRSHPMLFSLRNPEEMFEQVRQLVPKAAAERCAAAAETTGCSRPDDPRAQPNQAPHRGSAAPFPLQG